MSFSRLIPVLDQQKLRFAAFEKETYKETRITIMGGTRKT
jgi:hypothetical protein